MSKSDLPGIVEEIERSCQWDHPSRLFSLVCTKNLLDTPGLPADIEQGIRTNWDGSEEHLSAVEQEMDPNSDEEALLAQLQWPDSVEGAAISLERLIVPPEVEAQAPEDPEEAANFIANHEARMEMRLVVGVLRNGQSWCALRMRLFDDDKSVAKGADLVPELVELLKVGFMSDDDLQAEN